MSCFLRLRTLQPLRILVPAVRNRCKPTLRSKNTRQKKLPEAALT
jgi:hypothetical protein